MSIGGKINLPRLADRVDLVFRGHDPDELVSGNEDDPSQSQVGLQVLLDESTGGNHRTDFTVGLSGVGTTDELCPRLCHPATAPSPIDRHQIATVS